MDTQAIEGSSSGLTRLVSSDGSAKDRLTITFAIENLDPVDKVMRASLSTSAVLMSSHDLTFTSLDLETGFRMSNGPAAVTFLVANRVELTPRPPSGLTGTMTVGHTSTTKFLSRLPPARTWLSPLPGGDLLCRRGALAISLSLFIHCESHLLRF
jgi:hypothetical protein